VPRAAIARLVEISTLAACMTDQTWILGLRAAGVVHLLTVAFASFTPIPANWDENLARLTAVHRRFAIAQNLSVGGVTLLAGIVSLAFAPDLVSGARLARVICAAIALWWGGRLVVLPWLRVWPELQTPFLRLGFALVHVTCAAFAAGYGWLALR
jgi:hypothetical protein